MAEEFDFSALRSYLQGQMDLGDSEVYLDEPWTPKKRMATPAAPAVAPSRPAAFSALAASAVPSPRPATRPQVVPPSQPQAPVFMSDAMPAPRSVSRTASPFESAASLQDFYAQINNEKVYAGKTLYRYEGPEHPAVLLLFQAPHAEIPAGHFFESSVAEMLRRMFASLNVAPESIGVTFLYKLPESRNFPPLLEAPFRKVPVHSPAAERAPAENLGQPAF